MVSPCPHLHPVLPAGPAPAPWLCKGPENTQRELCFQTKSIRSRNQPTQLFPIPSALAGLRCRAGSPHTPPFWEVGANARPRAPRQLNGRPGLSHRCARLRQGTSWPPRQSKAPVQSQAHTDHRQESSGLGADLCSDRPRSGGLGPHERTPRSLFPTTRVHTHLHTIACRHTHKHMHQPKYNTLCLPERHLGRSLSVLASLLHPNRYLSGKELELWRKDGGGQRAEKFHQPALWRPSGSRTRSQLPAQEGVQQSG